MANNRTVKSTKTIDNKEESSKKTADKPFSLEYTKAGLMYNAINYGALKSILGTIKGLSDFQKEEMDKLAKRFDYDIDLLNDMDVTDMDLLAIIRATEIQADVYAGLFRIPAKQMQPVLKAVKEAFKTIKPVIDSCLNVNTTPVDENNPDTIETADVAITTFVRTTSLNTLKRLVELKNKRKLHVYISALVNSDLAVARECTACIEPIETSLETGLTPTQELDAFIKKDGAVKIVGEVAEKDAPVKQTKPSKTAIKATEPKKVTNEDKLIIYFFNFCVSYMLNF